MKVTQWCPAFWDPMDCSPPGSSVHWILQARILEWVAMPFSRGSSQLRDWTHVSHIAGRFFYHLSDQGSLEVSKSPDSGFDTPCPFSGVSLVALTVRTLPEMQEVQFDPWVGKIPCRRARQRTPVFSPGESHGRPSPKATVHGAVESQTGY